ncbi:MAG: amino acid ABC transporter substrate-binding protein [Candidatus Competibacteraceae bacterium]|nr:amino acid ABC transporter substrate-binding protein [Candidatus Competibacteraceae bacterium]
MLKNCHRLAAIGLLLSLTWPVAAQNSPWRAADQLTGTLKKIKDSGVIVLGHRENSIPFAFRNAQGQPIGYSIDLCKAVAQEVGAELGITELRIDYQPVTPENRFARVRLGEVDLECGSTTDNQERRQQVAFSPTIFVTGTKLLVKKDGSIRRLRDLRGHAVAVTRDTSNAAAMQAFAERQRLGLTFVTGADHQESFGLLAEGKADAFANDEVLLYGMLAETKSGSRYRIISDFLSYEPYGLMYRKDDSQFADVIERTFRQLAESREIVWIYDRWFLKPLPSGIRLNLPMNAQLRELFQMLGLPAG